TAAVLKRALSAPAGDLPALARAARAALDQQHLLVVLKDPDANRLFGRKRWDGRMLGFTADYLMLVDTEVSSSKQSQDIRRDADYRVDLSDRSAPRATLTVTYRNGSDPGKRPGVWFVDNYRTFLRAYVPPGARLIDARGFDDAPSSYHSCDRQVLGGRVTIP